MGLLGNNKPEYETTSMSTGSVKHPGKAVFVEYLEDYGEYKKGDRCLVMGGYYVELAVEGIVKLSDSQHETGKPKAQKSED